MFAPYCPSHGTRVLLFADSIDAIIDTAAGPTIEFHCHCGYRGTWSSSG